MKHGGHVGHARGVPGCEIPIETRGFIKHMIHVCDIADIPGIKTGINRMVKTARLMEHGCHGCHGGSIPLVERTIKVGRPMKRVGHIRDFRSVPSANTLIEGPGIMKHPTH